MSTFIPAPAVAKLTGYASGQSFLLARPRLEREHDFPPPMPTSRRPLLWRADTVKAWISNQGHIGAANLARVTAVAGHNVVLLDAARSA